MVTRTLVSAIVYTCFAAETGQPAPCVDEEEQKDLREGTGLFAAYHKRQKKDVGTSASPQQSHYLDIAEGQKALWSGHREDLPSLFGEAIRVLAVPSSSAPAYMLCADILLLCG